MNRYQITKFDPNKEFLSKVNPIREYNLIMQKKSSLSKSQRDKVIEYHNAMEKSNAFLHNNAIQSYNDTITD